MLSLPPFPGLPPAPAQAEPAHTPRSPSLAEIEAHCDRALARAEQRKRNPYIGALARIAELEAEIARLRAELAKPKTQPLYAVGMLR